VNWEGRFYYYSIIIRVFYQENIRIRITKRQQSSVTKGSGRTRSSPTKPGASIQNVADFSTRISKELKVLVKRPDTNILFCLEFSRNCVTLEIAKSVLNPFYSPEHHIGVSDLQFYLIFTVHFAYRSSSSL